MAAWVGRGQRGSRAARAAVDEIECREQKRHTAQPHQPTVFHHPPKRDTLEAAQKKRGIAEGGQATANIGNDEDEKDQMMAAETTIVEAQPRSD